MQSRVIGRGPLGRVFFLTLLCISEYVGWWKGGGLLPNY